MGGFRGGVGDGWGFGMSRNMVDWAALAEDDYEEGGDYKNPECALFGGFHMGRF